MALRIKKDDTRNDGDAVGCIVIMVFVAIVYMILRSIFWDAQ